MFDLKNHFTKAFSVTENEWNTISGFLQEVSLPKNEFFIKNGSVCKRSGFILDGVMRYYSEDIHGDDPTCYFSFEGHYILDPFTYTDQKPSEINLVAVTNCTLYVISYDDDKKLKEILPKWKEITNSMLLEVTMEFANQKTMMSLNAAERYAYFIEMYPHLALRVPLQYVASYLGIAQPSLSRLRKNLSKQL